jgi:hypothetical protein
MVDVTAGDVNVQASAAGWPRPAPSPDAAIIGRDRRAMRAIAQPFRRLAGLEESGFSLIGFSLIGSRLADPR